MNNQKDSIQIKVAIHKKSIAEEIHQIFENHELHGTAFGLAFVVTPGKKIHWITNIPREAGITLFRKVYEAMQKRTIQ